MSFLKNLFNNCGEYGPLILLFFSWYLLRDKNNLFFYYTIGFFLNILLNLILKGIFQQPRPSENLNNFNLALTHGKRFIFKNGIPYDIFGMPSGHSESCFYSTTFVYLALKDKNILFIYLLISFITMFQRIAYNYHTLFQVFVGTIVGITFANIIYNFVKTKIKGKITESQDNYGPF